MKTRNQKQAFPCYGNDGMTLRDYFAAKAMQALIKKHTYAEYDSLVSERSYIFADAMLKAREQ